ncbi:MAG: GDYXXLXY domain-containing protein [Candidatus Nucleicultricaceae bacterium]
MKRTFILISLAFIIGYFNYSIFQKEQILKYGEPVYLKIEPVDPRSLMQGDYVIFKYSLTKTIKQTPKNPTGFVVIKVDENRVGHFVRFHQDELLLESEKLLPYRTLFGGIEIRPNSFFFEEGHGRIFERAPYAMLKFKGAHQLVLYGLADQNLKQITAAK